MRRFWMCLPVVLGACLVPVDVGNNRVACQTSGGATVCPGDGGVGTLCGGFAGLRCGAGLICADLPDDGCDPAAGGADCAGVCAAGDGGAGGGGGGALCGGFAGLGCGSGLICVDVPEDGCDPNSGGADCPGRCVAGECNVDAGSWLNQQTPLWRCGRTTTAEYPQAGLCDAGSFPDLQVSCGPPFVVDAGEGPDGGSVFMCGCTETGPRTCLKLCACDSQCLPAELCDVARVFWGDDYPTRTRGLCRQR